MKNRLFVSICFCFTLVILLQAQVKNASFESDIIPPKKIPVLIIDGFSNHQWDKNTEYLQKILESSGKFEVTVSTCPDQEQNKTEWESMRCAAFQQTIIRALQWLSGNEVDKYVESDFPTSENIVLRSPIPDEFEKVNASTEWELQFADPGTGNWQDKWFLDGQLARIENSEKGMNFMAGPVNRNDAHHAVLWTKDVFKGDIKIEYNYTKTDSQVINVNILFIQATGIGQNDFAQDITKWNDYRKVPTMSKYWRNMNLIHISYAAFPMVNEDPDNDYIRVRRYPATKNIAFKDTEVPPSFEKTGLFLPDVPYKMTWIKTSHQLLLQVEGNGETKKYAWDLTDFPPIAEGRIGLRHMFTRSAQYSDFKIYTKTKGR